MRIKGGIMATMNISLPDELKERMEGIAGVKWSRVAAEAFEREVNSRTLKGNDMQAAIERLKTSRVKVEETDRQSGIECGKSWAMKDAEWDQLVAVAELDEASLSAGLLFQQLAEFGYDDDEACSVFAKSDDEEVSDAEAVGFVIGARMVKEAVDAAE
jgi:hypothetical protein